MFKKAVFIIILLMSEQASFAQSEESKEPNKMMFGFNLGINRTSLDYKSNNSITEEKAVGFRLGIISEYPVAKHFFVSTKAELSFNRNTLEINESSKYEVMPVSLESKLHLGYKIGEGDLKPYLLFGPSFIIPVMNDEAKSDVFKTGSDIALDFGVGLERNFTHFFFSPELRYSYGLTDINRNPAIQSLNLHNITLVLNFKG